MKLKQAPSAPHFGQVNDMMSTPVALRLDPEPAAEIRTTLFESRGNTFVSRTSLSLRISHHMSTVQLLFT